MEITSLGREVKSFCDKQGFGTVSKKKEIRTAAGVGHRRNTPTEITSTFVKPERCKREAEHSLYRKSQVR